MNKTCVSASVAFATLVLYLWNYAYWRRNRVKQRFPQVPIFGDTFRHIFQYNPYHEVLESLYKEFDTRYMGFYQYLQPGLMLRDPSLIKQICGTPNDTFMDRKMFLPVSTDVLWSKNIFALQGTQWREMRNTLNPTFNANKMREMLPHVDYIAKRFCAFHHDKEGSTIEIELKDAFSRYTTDVIASIAFGYQVDSLNEPENEFYIMGKKTMASTDFWRNFKLKMSLILPFLGRIFKAHIFDQTVSNFFRDKIYREIERRKAGNIQRSDMLNLLMRVHLPDPDIVIEVPRLRLGLDDITSQALVFFLGGFETASTALCFMAYELALNPDIQDTLIGEIDDHSAKNSLLTYDGVRSLKYLDMVLKETLRKWPPLLNMDRMCGKSYTIAPVLPGESPVRLRKNTMIWVPIWAIHRDPKIWPNPELFDPERFRNESETTIPAGTYLPFGMGNRSCLGTRFAVMEIKILMYRLLSRFRLVTTSRSEIPFVPVIHSFSLASENGFHFGLEKRDLI